MKAVKFTFADDQVFSGFADGTTWNGFDNVCVTPEVHKEICDYFRAQYKITENDQAGIDYLMQSFDELEPGKNGLYSYAGGFATQIDEPDTDDIYAGIDRFSLEGETLATISDAVWKAVGDGLIHEFPDAEYGDLSPATTIAFNDALRAVVLEWIEYNVPTDARCDNCHCSAGHDDIGTTCRNCGRGVIR